MMFAVVVLYIVMEITPIKKHGFIANLSTKQPTEVHQKNTSLPRLLQWDSGISPDGRYLATSYTGDYKDRFHYYQVFITDVYTDTMHRIFSGDFRTLSWEWTPDNRIKISYNCGTGCLATKIIDINKSVSMANLQYDEINEKNGWQVTFTKSF
ncbi:hypothetical protein HY339_00225 [Candidatus Gottesmanbacteria bacterium]|nr:hypothetical protein [Candidatus Gottesmanbacteria bacterium]